MNINEVYRIINYNKKYVGYTNSRNEKIINENQNINEFSILNSKKRITKLNNPSINKKFAEYLKNKQFSPSETQIQCKYKNYVKKVREYNKKVIINNNKKRQMLKLQKTKQNKIVKNIDKLLNNKTHTNNKSIMFTKNKSKQINSLFKPKSKLKYDNKLSKLYNKL